MLFNIFLSKALFQNALGFQKKLSKQKDFLANGIQNILQIIP